MFDDFGQAGGQFPRRQGGEHAGVGHDEARLVERADEVLAGGVVDGHFAADAGVNLGEEGCRHLDEGHTPHICGGDEPRKVPHHPAAEGDHRRAAVEPASDGLGEKGIRDGQRFRVLAGGNGGEVGAYAGLPQGGEGPVAIQGGDGSVGHHQDPVAERQSAHEGAEAAEAARGDMDGIAAGRQVDVNFGHGYAPPVAGMR